MSSLKVPYPPSPPDVPEGLTDYADSYTKQQNLLLAGLFVFLIFYLGLVALFGMLTLWCALTLTNGMFVVKLLGLILCGTFFLFLVKGFFKSHAMNKEMHIEITEDEHPVLFAFIDQLCDELGAPKPNKVFVSPDVNAAVMPRTSLVNLFVEPKKDLLIGLGLVNCVNLSEFKAVLAHEFGHFGQSAMGSSYAYVASRIIGDLVEGEDWFDRFINWCKRQDNAISVFGHVIGGCLWVGRKILEWLYMVITLQRLAVSREREFHADLVAVSAAGSNAVVHCLLRTEFGHQCFMQAIDELATALDHKLYSKDLYLHQDRAAAVVRRKKKEPELGMPPVLKKPNDGKDVSVFDAEEEEINEDIPPMWRTHPANSDREANAKEQFVPAVVDHRSPWILFADAADLRERMSWKFYRMVFRIPKSADLTDAQKVQEYIDNEHAETTYDPKYQGAYDDRPLEPGDINELNGIIADSPWTEERMEKVFDKLYDGCKEHADAHAELHKELASLRNNVVGKPSRKMKDKIEDVEKDLDENWEWFKSFDRRVYLLHVQMAAAAAPELKHELVERYRFQLEVQRFYQEARQNFNKADAYIAAYGAAVRGEIQVPNDFGAEVISVLRTAWKVLKKIIQDAREVNLPALKNFEEGERLAEFILEGKLVPEPPLTELKGAWVQKLMTQLQGVKNRCFRLHFKSLGGILAMQEKIAARWVANRTPVAADVEGFVSEEVVAAEVVDAEPARVYTSVDEIHVVPFRQWADELEVLDAEVVEAAGDGEIRVEAIGDPGQFVSAPLAVFAAGAAPAAPPPEPEPLPLDAEEVLEAAIVEEPEATPLAFDTEPAKPAPVSGVLPAPTAHAEPEYPFAFDPAIAALTPKAEAKPPARPEPSPAPAEEIFSLDAEEVAVSPPPVAKPAPRVEPPRQAPDPAVEEVFDLGAAEEVVEVAEAVVVEPESVAPAKAAVDPKSLSGSTSQPTVRTPFATPASAPAPTNGAAGGIVKPAEGRRPAVRITFVKPGETSPIGK